MPATPPPRTITCWGIVVSRSPGARTGPWRLNYLDQVAREQPTLRREREEASERCGLQEKLAKGPRDLVRAERDGGAARHGPRVVLSARIDQGLEEPAVQDRVRIEPAGLEPRFAHSGRQREDVLPVLLELAPAHPAHVLERDLRDDLGQPPHLDADVARLLRVHRQGMNPETDVALVRAQQRPQRDGSR